MTKQMRRDEGLEVDPRGEDYTDEDSAIILGLFGPEHMKYLSTEQIRGLTPEQIKALEPEQIRGLTPEQIKMSGAGYIGGLTPEQLRELTVEQLRLIPRERIEEALRQIEETQE